MTMHDLHMTQQKSMIENYTIEHGHTGYIRQVFTKATHHAATLYREYRLWRDPRFANGTDALFHVMKVDYDCGYAVRHNSWENLGAIIAHIPIDPDLHPRSDPEVDGLEILLERAVRNIDPKFFKEPLAEYKPGEPDSRAPHSSLDGPPKGEGSSPEILVQQKAGRVAKFARHKSPEPLVVYNDMATRLQCKLEEVLALQWDSESDDRFATRAFHDGILTEAGITNEQLREALKAKMEQPESEEETPGDARHLDMSKAELDAAYEKLPMGKDELAKAYAKLKSAQDEEESKRDTVIAAAGRVGLRLQCFPCDLCNNPDPKQQHDDDCPVGDLHRALDALKEGKVGEGDAENKKGYRVYCKWEMEGSVDVLATCKSEAESLADNMVYQGLVGAANCHADNILVTKVLDDTECNIDVEALLEFDDVWPDQD